jgi:charged multivesicular body protein 4A/B
MKPRGCGPSTTCPERRTSKGYCYKLCFANTCLNREELREQHAIGEEIGEAITQSIGNQGLDETELDEELEALQQEKLDEEMLKAGPTPADRLPSAPEGVKAGKAPAQEEDEEEELRKLQAEMAM